MKYLLYCIIACASIFCFNPTSIIAQPIGDEKPQIHREMLPVDVLKDIKSEVSESVKVFQEQVDNIDSLSYYKSWTAVDTTTGKTKHISDLNEQQMRGFYIYQAGLLSQNMSETVKNWQFGLINLQVTLPKDAAKGKSTKQKEKETEKNIAAVKDTIDLVKRSIDDVTKIRKRLAVKQETMISDMISVYKNKDKKLVEELQKVLDKVKVENDNANLIDRKPAEQKGKK